MKAALLGRLLFQFGKTCFEWIWSLYTPFRYLLMSAKIASMFTSTNSRTASMCFWEPGIGTVLEALSSPSLTISWDSAPFSDAPRAIRKLRGVWSRLDRFDLEA